MITKENTVLDDSLEICVITEADANLRALVKMYNINEHYNKQLRKH